MKKYRLALFFLFYFYLPLCLFASTPKFEVSLSNSRVQTGESVLYTITAKWPKSNSSYSFLSPDPLLENLILLRKGESQEVIVDEGKEWLQKTFELEFSAPVKGQARIRSFDLNYLSRSEEAGDAQNQITGKFNSPEQILSIQSPEKFTPLHLLLFSLLGIGGAALGGFLIFFPKKSAPEACLIVETPQEIALRGIKVLGESLTLSPKEILQELFFQFRDFIIRHFDLSLAAHSEADLIRILNESGKEIGKTPVCILEKISELRYANEELSREPMVSLIKDVLRYIEVTKSVS
ncbi:MAG: hypothetical protein EXS63_01850 [Candidatus Omnitrophica bacterium]|nr:hypothetical protein [Candidatus Omnitrophota bacterium]